MSVSHGEEWVKAMQGIKECSDLARDLKVAIREELAAHITRQSQEREHSEMVAVQERELTDTMPLELEASL
jgi:hypothetical protein